VRFSHPGWLIGGAFACVVLVALWRWYDARQQRALALFISIHLRTVLTQSISVLRRRLQRGLALAALALLFVTLAGPQLGFRWEKVSRRGNEIVFAIDTSRSMLTPDVKPNRLTRAKLAIDDFANRLDGDAVGIVAFAGSAFLVCPLTLDYGAFHESLSAVDTATIPRGGTNIASAIRDADAALRRRPGSDKILILVTDGEDLEGGALAAAETAKSEDGLTIFTVGVGSAGGDLIPIPPDQGGGFVKDETGAYVKSRLDEAGLKAIAAATGGFYVPLGTQGEGLETIAKTVLGSLAKHDLASRQQKIYIERYQWPLAASLGTLLLSLLIGTRRRVRARAKLPAISAAPVRAARSTAAGATAASLLALLFCPWHSTHGAAPGEAEAPPPEPHSASPTPGAPGAPGAPRARVPGAVPTNPTQAYNSGTQAYRSGQFPQAAQAFQQSISHAVSSDAKRLADQEDAYYNLGNSLYRTGQKSEQSGPQEALQKWNDAVKAYETALQLRPDDADSKYNRDLVKRKIAKLQQQQNQNQNQNQNDKQNPQQKPGQSPPQNQGQGQGQGQPPNQGQPPPAGQPPPNPQQPPPPTPGQPPGKGQPPPPNQAPPPGQSEPPPPQSANNNDAPPAHPPPSGSPPTADPQAADPNEANDPNDAAARAADTEHAPGQMSREEARELLDSAKDDEHRPPGTPLVRRQAGAPPPEQPFKNW